MPAALIDSATLAANDRFHRRVGVAVLRKAQAVKQTLVVGTVVVDGVTVPNPDNVAQHQLADRILADPTRYAGPFALNLAARPELNANESLVTDADINTWVGNAWPFIAGLRPTT